MNIFGHADFRRPAIGGNVSQEYFPSLPAAFHEKNPEFK
jgi:hypothetical protein